mmetsp:Transcript_33283/g.43838  ORF Transcript_33283/g.43838 Transcript_33283/m.43838 type:complete len:123 (+) Transcript_33283:757-1125(+)
MPPCRDKTRYNAAPNQQIFFPEYRNLRRGCAEGDQSHYTQVGDSPSLNEWNVQGENGVLLTIDERRMSSYSFFPSSMMKKEVPLYFFQRRQRNYKVSCSAMEGRSFEEIKENNGLVEAVKGS